MDFNSFGLTEEVMDGIRSLGYKTPTPIQMQAIPVIKEGRDLIGNAQTGTGKTGAFLLPVLDYIVRTKAPGIQCLILAPTRELVKQIDEQIDGLGYFSGARSVPFMVAELVVISGTNRKMPFRKELILWLPHQAV